MGLLDDIFGSGDGSGLMGGLPASWQYQNPKDKEDADKRDAILASLTNPLGGIPSSALPSPFGAVPQVQGNAPSPFDTGAAPIGFNPAMMQPQQPQAPVFAPQPQQPPNLPQTNVAPPPPVAPPAAPEQLAGNIPVGNYQMPRIGTADDFTPDDDTTPAAAKPAQGQGGPTQALAPQSLPPAPSSNILSRIGNPDGLINRLMGTDTRSVALQQQAQTANMTYKALVAKGVDPQVAATAVAPGASPDLLKTLIAQNFGADKFQHVTRKGGPLDGEQGGAFNPATGVTTWDGGASGIPGAAPANGVQGMVDRIQQKQAAGASRADLIKEIPAQYQGYITSLLDGKATPANMGRGQERGALMTLAHAVDPTFDETMIPARVRTATDFTPQGKSGASIVAFNTVQHHIGKLSDDFEKLGNAGQGGFALLNQARNALAAGTPIDPVRQKAVQAVNDDLKAVSDEMSAAYKAGHVSDTEIKSWNSLVNSNMPLNQARQAISDFVDLLNGKRDALNTVHRQIMGGDANIIDKTENEAITNKVHTRNAGTSSTSGKPAIVTQNGHTYNLQPDGSYK